MARERGWFDDLVRETAIINTKNGLSFKGIVAAVYADAVLLQDFVDLNAEPAVVVQGPLGIPRENVECVQLIKAVTDDDAANR